MPNKKIVIVGPAYPLRGGLASFDERLAREFNREGFDTTIYTFSLQYPGFLFPGTTQYSSDPAPAELDIRVAINSVNPLNWIKVGNQLRKLKPAIIIVRYWLPFMGPCLGTILRRAKKNKVSRIVCIADNIIPHEKRVGDKSFTSYFLKSIDGFITMSEKVLNDLKKLAPSKPASLIAHPLYDNFGDPLSKSEARSKLGINGNNKIILFFGFIRNYKGLDILLRSMAILKKDKDLSDLKLLVAGEYYEDRKSYDQLIKELGIEDSLFLKTDFIPDSEVRFYLSAADCVVQPYRKATQSGVTPLAYHFEKPMIVTNVGGLPAMVPANVGLIADPTPEDIAEKIKLFYQLGEDHFLPGIREEKKKYSWGRLVEEIVIL